MLNIYTTINITHRIPKPIYCLTLIFYAYELLQKKTLFF